VPFSHIKGEKMFVDIPSVQIRGYRSATEINQAMGRVYNYMFLAVAVSMIVSLAVASSAAAMALFFGPVTKWITMFAPLLFVFLVPIAINSGIPREGAIALLLAFAGVMGLSLSAIMAVFTGMSVVTAFLGAAVLFGTMSLYGYFTKRSLDSMGKYLLIGLIAIIIASIINIFIGSSLMQMIISAVAIVLFMALTAYDTQQIREQLSYMDENHRAEIIGALSLYLNFINIFTSLLQLTGSRNE
jgi:FtsH-binding integral membrane protein